MKYIFLTLLFLSSSMANAQIKTIDLVAGLNYDYRILSNASTLDFEPTIKIMNSRAKAKLNYIVGFNSAYEMFGNFDFKFGIRYTEIGYYSHKDAELTFADMSNINFTSYSKSKYLEFPLAVRINSKKENKLNTFFEFGVAPSYFINYTFYSESDNNTVSEIQEPPYYTLYLPLTISLGAEYKMPKNVLFIQLINKTGILPNFNTISINERYFQTGLEAGIRFKLNRGTSDKDQETSNK